MKPQTYITYLMTFIGLLFLMLFALDLRVPIFHFDKLIVVSIIGLAALNLFVFIKTYLLRRKGEKEIKIFNLSLKKIIYKMVFSAGVIAWYYKIEQPDSNLFVIPYIVIYLGFIIFESFMVSRE